MIPSIPVRLVYKMRSLLTAKRLSAFFLEEKLRRKSRYQPGHVRIGKFNWAYADSASFISSFRQIMVENWYGYNREVVTQFPIILDCGANIGLASLFFTVSSPEAKIIAFEPDPVVYRLLKENIVRNQLGDKVDAINAALWVGQTQVASFCPDGADGGRLKAECSGSVTVPVVRLREYLAEPVGLLKMDIEGAELEVLLDTVDFLKNVKQLIMEHHSFVNGPQRLGELISVLEDSGFRLQINNVHRWMNSLIQSPNMGTIDQLLIIYGRRIQV